MNLIRLSLCAVAALGLVLPVGAANGLSRKQAESTLQKLWLERAALLKQERTAELEAKSITLGEHTMPWLEKTFGDAPMSGRSLWISMHGGGGAPKAVNDQQWRNQIRLYQPEEGIVVAPRGPTDHWNLWHENHIDPLLQRLIDDFVTVRGVNPDRVYIMGYSAGGDGAWQLAPRMADRWAAAAMMAGHPGDASLLPLRNLPFAAFVGGEDAAYDRNKIVAERIKELDALQAADPKGYEHLGRVYPGLPHWMNLKDAEALPWMFARTRNPWPKKVVWVLDDVPHTRYYWLAIPETEAAKGRKLVAEVAGQVVKLSGDVPKGVTLRLSDALLNLDNKITVQLDSREIFKGRVPRTEAAIRESLQQRADPSSAATATLKLER